MRQFKKWLVLVLCLALFAAMFAGCGPKTPESSATPGTDNTEAAATPTPAPTEEAPQGAKYMKAGETYRILIWDTRTENQQLEMEGVQGQLNRDAYRNMIDNYGVTPVWVVAPADWLGEAMNSAYAGSPICELFYIGGPFTLPSLYTYSGEKGAILAAISDYDIDFSDPEYWNQAGQAVGTFGGKQYVIAHNYIGLGIAALNIATVFNKTLIQKGGYTAQQLYDWSNNGEWTFEKYREVARNCTDLDNGVYGTSVNNGALLISALVVANGSDMIARKDGVDVFNLLDSKALTAVNFLTEMARDDKSVFLDYTADEKTTFADETFALMVTYVNRIQERVVMRMSSDIGVIMPPKGPDAEDYISEMNWFDGFTVFKTVENVPGAIEFASIFYKPAYARSSDLQADLFTAQAQACRMDDQSIEILRKIPMVSHVSSYMLYWSAGEGSESVATICAQQIEHFVDGSLSPATYYASMEDRVNYFIQSTMDLKS